LGTRTVLSKICILDGIDEAKLISSENNPEFISIASKFLKDDSRLKLVVADREDWIIKNLENVLIISLPVLGMENTYCLMKPLACLRMADSILLMR
jgi:hypothetical protein